MSSSSTTSRELRQQFAAWEFENQKFAKFKHAKNTRSTVYSKNYPVVNPLSTNTVVFYVYQHVKSLFVGMK